MAVYPTTTPAGVLKGASRPLPTSSPVTRRFHGVLHLLDDLIAAESDLDGYSGQDPALDAWIRDAERARRVTLDAINELGDLSMYVQGDAQSLRPRSAYRARQHAPRTVRLCAMRRELVVEAVRDLPGPDFPARA